MVEVMIRLSEQDIFLPLAKGFTNGCDMIAALAKVADSNIRVDAYPHRHLDTDSQKRTWIGSRARLTLALERPQLNSFWKQ